MSKKSKVIKLIIPSLLSAVLLSACGEAEDPQRDVYASQQECLSDWGEESSLCEQMNDSEIEEYRRQNPSFIYAHPMFFGPSYYSGDRSVMYKGRAISASKRSSTLSPVGVRPNSSIASRPSVSSPRSVSYGGFGSSSRGVSSGS